MAGSGKPLISFVIPFFNNHPFLKDCLQSVHAYTKCDFEIILIDDASSDTAYRADLPKTVTLLCNDTRCGASFSRNRGIEAASSTYICFLDSDDKIMRDPEELILAADALAASIPVEAVPLIAGRLAKREGHQPSQAILQPRLGNVDNDPLLIQLNDFYTLLYRRDWLKQRGLRFDPDLTYSEDVLFLLGCIAEAEHVCVTGLDFYDYRRRGNSLTEAANSIEKLHNRMVFFEKMAQVIAPFGDSAGFRLAKAYKWNIRLLLDLADQLNEHDLRAILTEKTKLYGQYLTETSMKSAAKSFGFSWAAEDSELLSIFQSDDIDRLVYALHSGRVEKLFSPFIKRG